MITDVKQMYVAQSTQRDARCEMFDGLDKEDIARPEKILYQVAENTTVTEL
jgi:hypothetical protein